MRSTQKSPMHPRTTSRAMHLLDVENLFALEHDQQVPCDADRIYRSIAPVGPGDLMTVAADRSRWVSAKAAFSSAQVRPGRGVDGADRALIEYTDLAHIARRFDTLVIGSGDHAFIDVAYRARVLELRVIVVSRPGALSRRLAPYADVMIEMPLDRHGALHTRAA